jgi:DNA-directed RNA polymerase subunit M/transcription elongation factor TFIIS
LQSYTYFQEQDYYQNQSKISSVVISTKELAYKFQKSATPITCPNCGNVLAFYQQVQGNKIVCFVCRRVSLTQKVRSAAC